MKQYMVIETFLPGSKGTIYERFYAQGRMLPEGLLYVDSWLEKDGDRCFQLMETNDPSLFGVGLEKWKDLVSIEVIEVGPKPRKNEAAQPGDPSNDGSATPPGNSGVTGGAAIGELMVGAKRREQSYDTTVVYSYFSLRGQWLGNQRDSRARCHDKTGEGFGAARRLRDPERMDSAGRGAATAAERPGSERRSLHCLG